MTNKHLEADTQTTDPSDCNKTFEDRAVQMNDMQYFTTFYDHVQSQHQELFKAKVDFEHLVFNFDRNVTHLGDYMKANFHGLAGQLHFQLNSFFHNVLSTDGQSLQTIQVGPVPPSPQLPAVRPRPPPHELLIQDQFFEAQEHLRDHQGIQPINLNHPWRFLPYSRDTRSPSAYAGNVQRLWTCSSENDRHIMNNYKMIQRRPCQNLIQN